jgi:hypothetical protein
MRIVLGCLIVAASTMAWSASAGPINATDCGDQYPFQQQIDTAARIYIARLNLAGPSAAQYRNVRLVCRARSSRTGLFGRARTFALEIDLDVNAKNSHGVYTGFHTRSISFAGQELTVASSDAIVVAARANLSAPPAVTPEDCDGIALPCDPNPTRGSVFFPGTGVPKPPDDGPLGIDRASANATSLFNAKRYAELDTLIARYASLMDRVDDGRFKLSGIDQFLGMVDQRSSDVLMADVERWRSVNPKSIGAALLEAEHWYAAAWHARGNGYADSVSPEGLQLFHERLERAMKVLLGSESYAASNPLWFTVGLDVQLGLDVPQADRFALYKRGIDAFPEYFPLHFAYMVGLLPKWGGSNEAMSAFVDGVVNSSSDSLKAQMYTRLWWRIDQLLPLETSVFDDMGASWHRMKEGFEALIKSFPDSVWIRANYASFACRAGDAASYSRLRTELGNNINYYLRAFPSNFSLDVCDKRASNATI